MKRVDIRVATGALAATYYYCEHFEQAMSLIRSHNLDVDQGYELTSERDLITLLEADLGIAFAPAALRALKR